MARAKGKIIIVGDIFPIPSNVNMFSVGDIDSLFGNRIVELFQSADVCICNLEGALTDNPARCKKFGPVKVAPTSSIKAFKKLGFDYCMLANNHITDGGHNGLLETFNTLENAGIGYIGAGKDAKNIRASFVQVVGGKKIGFYNVCETMFNKPTSSLGGAWLYDEYVVCNDIKNLKQQCDYCIVIYHGGVEKFTYPSPNTRLRFHRMADCGADVIISQHTHCVGCEEYYNGAFLLYGQGDFLLNNFAPGLTDSGIILELEVDESGILINKHLVDSFENRFVRYSEIQDFSAYSDRSEKVKDEIYVQKVFQNFCDGKLKFYLTAFKNPSWLRLLQQRLFPRAYMKWLFKYSEKNFLFALHTLRSEQNRETAIVGMEDIVEKWNE